MTSIFKLLSFALFLICGSAYAQSNAEILKQIKGKSGEIKEFRDLLNSPDASIRISAFETMYKSESQALRQLALDEAINSQDAVLRSMAFQEIILSLKTLSMNIKVDELTPESRKIVLSAIGDSYNLEFRDFKRVGATLVIIARDNRGSQGNANINGLRFNWENNRCQGDATLQTGGLLSGAVRCDKELKAIKIPLSAVLR